PPAPLPQGERGDIALAVLGITPAGPETAVSHPPTVPPPCADYPIDLATALALAGAANPTIALAFEAVRASQAEQPPAAPLLPPPPHAGPAHNAHRGTLQAARGWTRDVARQSAYAGAGAAAVGTGTVRVPGVQVVGHLADAFFEPLATRQRVAGVSLD